MLKVFLELIKIGMFVPDQLPESELLHKSKVTLRISLAAFDDFINSDKEKIPEQIKDWSSMPLT